MGKKRSYSATPLDPPKFAYPRTKGGGVEKVQIFRDNTSGDTLLQCPACDRFVSYKKSNEKPYLTHRGGDLCIKQMNAKNRQAAKQEAHAALQLCGLQTSSSKDSDATCETEVKASDETMPQICVTDWDLPPSSPPLSPAPEEAEDLMQLPNDDDHSQLTECFITVINDSSLSNPEDLEDDGSCDPECLSSEYELPNPCQGQPIYWTPGSLWSMYPFKQHERDDFLWKPIGVRGKRTLIVRSKRCSGVLLTPRERRDAICNSCQAILSSPTLRAAMQRATQAQPHTPYNMLHFNQIESSAAVQRRANMKLRIENMRLQRQVARLETKIDDGRRVLMKLASNDIPGAGRVLEVSLNRGDSAKVLLEKLDAAISRKYRPHGQWTQREYDIAFLTKALGGPRLLYVLQQAHHFPSASSLRRNKKLPQILISADLPTDDEINTNIGTMLGSRPPPSRKDVGQTLMVDGIALEEVPRYDASRNLVLGLCREHSSGQKKTIDNFADLEALREGLDKGQWHYSKDGTVLVLAPVTSHENYYPTPVVISGSCKCENASNLSKLIRRFIKCYNEHPMGRERHGPILQFATDGESSFRAARFELCLSNPTVKGSAILRELAGFNLQSGPDDLLGSCDPKHVFKRYAQLLRSYTLELQLGDTTITYQDIRYALSASGVSDERISLLLNPQDKQNVPIALDLLKELRNASIRDLKSAKPGDFHRVLAVKKYAEIVSLFIDPFTNIEMGLAQQVRKLSTYAHAVFALYRRHRQKFMKTALYADSMSIVKTIITLVARYQAQDGTIPLYIIQIGTDREEGVFSQIRTQDHTRNCDILQLGQKSCIGAEINRILEENPDLNRGHARRNIRNSKDEDHINPASLGMETDFRVSSVDLRAEYDGGREDAANVLDWKPDWEVMWEQGSNDILRPFGRYVGSQMGDKETGNTAEGGDLDESEVEGTGRDDNSLISAVNQVPHSTADLEETVEEVVGAETDHQVGGADADSENGHSKHSGFISIDGKKYCKSTACTKYLISPSSRKVVIRQFRAAGMTIKDITQRTSSLALEDSSTSTGVADKSYLFNKDLGAVLCRCDDGRTVALAVVEILHFKHGLDRSGKITFDIQQKELESEGIQVVGQVIDLSHDSLHDGGRWVWTRKYVDICGAEETDTIKQYRITIPGNQFQPLRPGLKEDPNTGELTWVIDSSQLEKASSTLWSFLVPDSDLILLNIDKLPKLSSPLIPYRADGCHKFVIDAAKSAMVKKYNSDDTLPCLLCGASLKLKNMRNHIGYHILRAAREISDDSLPSSIKVGPNPCGWCGKEGCKTQLKSVGKGRYTILSNCAYHYERMVYGSAAKSSATQPCTNVPLICSLCPADKKLIPTFWKYNLQYHLQEFHRSANDEYPPLPPVMIVTTYISQKEEEVLGVEKLKTEEYRDYLKIPGSDDVRVIEEEQRRRGRSDSSGEQMEPRKKTKRG